MNIVDMLFFFSIGLFLLGIIENIIVAILFSHAIINMSNPELIKFRTESIIEVVKEEYYDRTGMGASSQDPDIRQGRYPRGPIPLPL
jgi:hypothetical protein